MTSALGRLPSGISDLDPDRITRLNADGRALPALFYTDPDIRKLEDELIFRRSWQVVATLWDLREPGDYVTATIASVPIVVVRDKDGEIRAFVNVCRHRGYVLAAGSGSCRALQCAYHAWTYGLDGSLKGAPGFAPKNRDQFSMLSLRPVAVDTFGGFVFVCLEPQESLEEQLGDLPRLMAEAGYDFPFASLDSGLTPLDGEGNYEGTLRANWKVFYENSSECYHCPTAHANTLCAVTDTDAIDVQLTTKGKFGMVAGLPFRDNWRAKFPEKKSGSQYGFALYSLWPNTIIFSGYIGEHVTRYEPVDTSNVRYVARSYTRPDLAAEPLAEVIDVLFTKGNQEDLALIERTQIGLESGYYEPGPLVAVLEENIRRFQGQVWESLRPAFG